MDNKSLYDLRGETLLRQRFRQLRFFHWKHREQFETSSFGFVSG